MPQSTGYLISLQVRELQHKALRFPLLCSALLPAAQPIERRKAYIISLGNVGSHLIWGENNPGVSCKCFKCGMPKHEQDFLLSRIRDPHLLFLEGNLGTLQSWARALNLKWKQVTSSD